MYSHAVTISFFSFWHALTFVYALVVNLIWMSLKKPVYDTIMSTVLIRVLLVHSHFRDNYKEDLDLNV